MFKVNNGNPKNVWNLFKVNNFQCQWTSKCWLGGLFNFLDTWTYFEICYVIFWVYFDCCKRLLVYSATFMLQLSSNDFTARKAAYFCYALIEKIELSWLSCSTNLQSFVELGCITICTVASPSNHKSNYPTNQKSSFVVFHHFIASLWIFEGKKGSYIFVVISFLLFSR